VIKRPNCSPAFWKSFPSFSRHLGDKGNIRAKLARPDRRETQWPQP
jgi:hypothetical protein